MPRWVYLWATAALAHAQWGWQGVAAVAAAHVAGSLAAWRYRVWRDQHG